MEENKKKGKGLIKEFKDLTHTKLIAEVAKTDPLERMTKDAEMHEKMGPIFTGIPKRKRKAVA